MKEKSYKPQMPDVMEVIFDACYLTFDLIAGILFFVFSKGNAFGKAHFVSNDKHCSALFSKV